MDPETIITTVHLSTVYCTSRVYSVVYEFQNSKVIKAESCFPYVYGNKIIMRVPWSSLYNCIYIFKNKLIYTEDQPDESPRITIIYNDITNHMDEIDQLFMLCKFAKMNIELYNQYININSLDAPIKIINPGKTIYSWNYTNRTCTSMFKVHINQLRLELGKPITGFISLEEFNKQSVPIVIYGYGNYKYNQMILCKSIPRQTNGVTYIAESHESRKYIQEFLRHIEIHNMAIQDIDDPSEAYLNYCRIIFENNGKSARN